MSLDGNPSSLSDVADTSGERFHWTAHPEFHNGSDVCSIGGSGFSGPHGTVRADDYLIRIFDLSVALVILIAVAPFLLLLVVLLKLGSPGPVFFAQKRVGKNGALFSCLKFRTMVVDAQARLDHLLKTCPQSRAEWERDHKLRNDVRITPLGQFMRKFSLDELPQLRAWSNEHRRTSSDRRGRNLALWAIFRRLLFGSARADRSMAGQRSK